MKRSLGIAFLLLGTSCRSNENVIQRSFSDLSQGSSYANPVRQSLMIWPWLLAIVILAGLILLAFLAIRTKRSLRQESQKRSKRSKKSSTQKQRKPSKRTSKPAQKSDDEPVVLVLPPPPGANGRK